MAYNTLVYVDRACALKKQSKTGGDDLKYVDDYNNDHSNRRVLWPVQGPSCRSLLLNDLFPEKHKTPGSDPSFYSIQVKKNQSPVT